MKTFNVGDKVKVNGGSEVYTIVNKEIVQTICNGAIEFYSLMDKSRMSNGSYAADDLTLHAPADTEAKAVSLDMKDRPDEPDGHKFEPGDKVTGRDGLLYIIEKRRPHIHGIQVYIGYSPDMKQRYTLRESDLSPFTMEIKSEVLDEKVGEVKKIIQRLGETNINNEPAMIEFCKKIVEIAQKSYNKVVSDMEDEALKEMMENSTGTGPIMAQPDPIQFGATPGKNYLLGMSVEAQGYDVPLTIMDINPEATCFLVAGSGVYTWIGVVYLRPTEQREADFSAMKEWRMEHRLDGFYVGDYVQEKATGNQWVIWDKKENSKYHCVNKKGFFNLIDFEELTLSDKKKHLSGNVWEPKEIKRSNQKFYFVSFEESRVKVKGGKTLSRKIKEDTIDIHPLELRRMLNKKSVSEWQDIKTIYKILFWSEITENEYYVFQKDISSTYKN